MTARRHAIMTARRRRDGSPVEPDAVEPRIVMGVTPRRRGLSRDPSRWGVVVAAVVIGCLDVIALVVIIVRVG